MFDITFVGHMCFDEIVRFQGERSVAPGSAVLCGALAAARVGKKVAVITKMSERDHHALDPMIQAGITTFIVPADVTTFMKVTYPTEDADVRELMQVRDAGYFTFPEIPTLETRYMHLAGITDREFTLEFIEQLKMAGYDLTLDVQSFVRHVDPESGRITLRDVSAKEHMFRYFSKIKLDNLEARTLTGSSDPEGAAVILESWGSRETLVTQGTGVLVRADHTTFHERLTNRGYSGRTGRGDTTFAGYLAWRIDHGVAESLKFASAIASIKLEKPGPFSGSLDDVLQRMKSDA